MKLGEKILKLRKKSGLSQEELGERLDVTRQTISNWELGETSPNTEQLKLLSKEFNISIDDLLDNDVKSVLVEKVSITEKNTKLIIRILIAIPIVLFILFIALVAIRIIIKSQDKSPTRVEAIVCSIYGEQHMYEIEFKELSLVPIAMGGDSYFDDILGLNKYNDAHQIFNIINDYVKKNGGTCMKMNNSNINDYVDVSIKEDSLSNKGMTLVLHLEEDKDFSMDFGEEFEIEKYNNKSNEYEIIDNECVFNMIGYTLNPGETMELEQNWGNCIGKLEKGSYRLIKRVSIDRLSNLFIMQDFVIE